MGEKGDNHLERELESFSGLWEGGYLEGDPLDPVSKSGYGKYGFISILHATYLRCIKPYVTSETVALEIGPGRGGWTRALLPGKEVWVLDALSAEYNRFYEYVGRQEHVKYIQVKDFECSELPDDHIDYMFSFGCLCHVSFDGISAYARNLFPKLKRGANCFWLVADRRKYDSFLARREEFDIWHGLAPRRTALWPLRMMLKAASAAISPAFVDSDPFAEQQGRWYAAGTENTVSLLESIGYKVLDADVETVPRDPIIHFIKP